MQSTFDDGELYDVILGTIDFGFDFYQNLIRQTNGPVLEVCCGTGRILLPALKNGIDIEGLDYYEGMLNCLRRKAAEQGLAPTLHQADMKSFRLAKHFDLIVVPFNAIIHNLTSDDMISCLTCCRDHLRPGGQLAFDTFFPNPEIINQPDGVRNFEIEVRHPKTGLRHRNYDTRFINRVEQIIRSVNELEILDDAGTVIETRTSETVGHFFYKVEMDLLLRLAGFSRWTISGDFDGRPLTKDSDALIVQAWKSP